MRKRGVRGLGALAVVGWCVLLLTLGPAAGGASLRVPRPVPIQSASLTQSGQDLVWEVRLSKAFSPTSLARAHAKLCLLLEKVSNGRVKSQICLAPGRHRRPPPRLIFSVGAGHGRYVPASVTRRGADGLEISFLPTSVELHYRRFRWQTESSVSGVGCSTARTCVALSPGHPRFLKLHSPRLVGCVASNGPSWVFNGSPNVHDIALTFDDGPWQLTPQLLTLLEHEHVPATFFQIGEWISVYGQHDALERRMLRDGDMIGDHTWTHPDMVGLGTAAQTSQIVQGADAIQNATGFYPCLYRAPFGNSDSQLLGLVRSLHMTSIQWDIDPRDWALPGVGEIEDNVIDNARNGGIVEMHDGGGPRQETLDALPTIISTLRQRGYKFVTITQMMGYRLIYK